MHVEAANKSGQPLQLEPLQAVMGGLACIRFALVE